MVAGLKLNCELDFFLLACSILVLDSIYTSSAKVLNLALFNIMLLKVLQKGFISLVYGFIIFL